MHSKMRFELEIAPLDLDLTLGCGQTFRWRHQPDGSWKGVIGQHSVSLHQRDSLLIAEAAPGGDKIEAMTANLLRMRDDIPRIQRKLRKDSTLAPGIARMKGLRIVKLDEWECLVSYILATYANIPRIMKMVDAVACGYGRRIAPGTHSFPTRRMLAKASVGELSRLGLGYRAKYVHQACKTIDDRTLDDMMKRPYEGLRTELIELPGVGDKVADCVSLFGFGKLESFPIDVWIERALERLYGQKGSYAKLRHFASGRFGQHAGYAQEYLYYNERMRGRTGACAFSKE
jgi:N-glycosylase/DNA lyase